MLLRRSLHCLLVLPLLLATLPAPASAVTTASEILQAKEQEKQILDQYNVVNDPLMNAWVNDVANRLWGQVARRDLPYNIKILDSPDINSFTIGGGYVYVNEGLLDFVQSDDELAGVIGHETGHNERRHTVTLPAKAQALNLLFGIASLFSPIVYRFGQIAEEGIIAKQQRSNELQADQYGLLLMSRAGYDPDSMVSFMNHLGAAQADHDSLVDKYLSDHPGFPSRVAHLKGYDELDPTKRTNDQILVQAIHDQESARYEIAATKFQQVLRADPSNTTAMLHLGEDQIALGETEKSQQTLGEAAQKGSSETRSTALSSIAALRSSEAKFPLTHPDLGPLRQELADTQNRETQAVATIALRRDAGKDEIKAVNTRIQNISYGIPDFSRVQVRMGSRLESVLRNFGAMSRSIDAAFSKSSATITGVGSLERNKESGLVKENADILHDLSAPLQLEPVPAPSLAMLPSYPRMFDDMALTDGDMVRALDAARSALAMLDVSLGDLNDFAQRLTRSQLDYGGDISTSDYEALVPLMKKSGDGLSKAAIAGSQAEQLYNLARSRQLQTRITMTGVGYPQDRYATLQYALQQRVKNPGVDFTAMQRDDLTPGEVATAAITAADTNTTPQSIITQAQTSHRQVIDVANERGMKSEALEIFLGLVYLDYTDDPVKKKHADIEVDLRAATANAATLLGVVRKTANVAAVKSDVKRPFRFLLCGDPGLVAEFRMLLLWARPDQNVPDDAVATLETIDPTRGATVAGPDVRAVIFLGRPGDTVGARLDLLQPLKLPIFALTVGDTLPAAQQPLTAPASGHIAEYVVARLDRESLKNRLFPHVIDRCKGIEIAVARRLPALRETVVSKLTRDAASSALKVAAASAVVDNVPLLGVVLGMVASAGDMVAITGIQVVLMMQIGAIYGKEPDVGRVWDLLPVVGGGLGWRALSRELAGFVPVAGVAIKGAIAYAGTIVVGEGAGFFYEHGYHMTKTQAGALYEEKKRSSLAFARDVIARIKRPRT